MNLGTNPNSRLEIVSTLNMQLQTRYAYYYNSSICLSKYNPAVHIGPVTTMGYAWAVDYTNGVQTNFSWPESYAYMVFIKTFKG